MLLSCTPAVQPEPAPVDPVPVDPVPEPEKEYSFQAQPSALTFEAEGGSQSIELTTDAAWVAFTQDDWITVSPAKGVGNKTITIFSDKFVFFCAFITMSDAVSTKSAAPSFTFQPNPEG